MPTDEKERREGLLTAAKVGKQSSVVWLETLCVCNHKGQQTFAADELEAAPSASLSSLRLCNNNSGGGSGEANKLFTV